ncbi:MAG: AraC family transcriptional regulator [Phycisphaerae bacterium]|nr:AraC family transcriptional regulator [Phycisphaerae bacterium]
MSDTRDHIGSFLSMEGGTDPLSDALEGLECRVGMAGQRRLAAPWGLEVPGEHPWFYVFLEGTGVATIAEGGVHLPLQAGDLLLIPRGCRHALQDQVHTPVVGCDEWLTTGGARREGSPSACPGRDGAATVLWGSLRFAGPRRGVLESSLPDFIHLPGHAGDPSPDVHPLVHLLGNELRCAQLSTRAIVNRLVQIVYARAVRSWVLNGFLGPAQGVKAFLDPKIGPAISLMHRRPEEPWTIDRLARRVHMSRTAFATQFTGKVGMPPGQYLWECRMRRACALLCDSESAIEEIALQTGYESAAAFSKAFKRWAGLAPSEFRRAEASRRTTQVGSA